MPNQNNYIIGLSTGARGVALLCLDCKGLFKKAVAFSGDYDQSKMKKDGLCNGYYGKFDLFEDRWTGEDNIVNRVDEFNTPIYLAHGKCDSIVPFNQTKEFYKALKKHKPSLHVELNINDTAGHNYGFWNSEIDNALKFIEN